MKVLVVDDSPLVHNVYRIYLTQLRNYEIVPAKNGLEGLKLLEKGTGPNLIILDLNMPEMNGLEFLKKLRSANQYNTIPVIVASTEDKRQEVLDSLRGGAQGFIKKPFTPESLHTAIDTVISKYGSS